MTGNATDLVPLVVDLDGTLLKSDMLLELGMAFVRGNPLKAHQPIKWMLEGKAQLKEKLSYAAPFDVTVLPYDSEVIDLITRARSEGRKTVLATASHRLVAEKIAAHLDLFDEVLATESTINLSAHRKRDLLIAKYGEKAFDYVGNSQDDICVWKSARYAFLVNPECGVERGAKSHGNIKQVVISNAVGARHWLKALRVHQWMKNLLIFVPLLAAHQITNLDLVAQGLLAFFLFGACASSVYVLNDLLDLADDRHHKTKRNRPFASGRISIKAGLLVFPLLLAAAFGFAALLLPWEFIAALLVYYVLTLAYSLYLKRQMSIDVIALAMLYTMRIIAGAAAFGLDLTFWMLAFSMFIFLSLALVKRYTELYEARAKGKTEKTRGRGYYPGDLEMISSLGASSGYLSVMVLALYLHDATTTAMYSHPHVIWLACPLLLFWITRIWMLTHRGQMHDDPVVFAIKDRTSMVVGLLFCAVFWIAS